MNLKEKGLLFMNNFLKILITPTLNPYAIPTLNIFLKF
jgi:hypothetical protein